MRRHLGLVKRYGIVIGFVLFCAWLAHATDGVFIRPANLLNVARQISINAILAAGMTFTIISGGIDLSVGSVLALAAVGVASMCDHGVPVLGAIVGGIGLGGLLGACNAFFITRFRIPPFIATLAMMTIARGAAFVYTGGMPIADLPDTYLALGKGYVLEVPIPVWLMALTYAGCWVLLERTRFGRSVLAIGGNEAAARLSGIRVERVKMAIYVLTSALAAFAGILLSARLGSGDPKLGQSYELNAIAAVVLGGTSLSGGQGKLQGTFFGALIIGALDNGLILIGVSAFYQMIVKGFVILGAVLLDQLGE